MHQSEEKVHLYLKTLFCFQQVTCNYFQMMSTLASPVPIQYQTLADSSWMYEPGSQFADFVRLQQANSTPAIERVYQFEPFTMGGWYVKHSVFF